jgi:predicted ATPase
LRQLILWLGYSPAVKLVRLGHSDRKLKSAQCSGESASSPRTSGERPLNLRGTPRVRRLHWPRRGHDASPTPSQRQPLLGLRAGLLAVLILGAFAPVEKRLRVREHQRWREGAWAVGFNVNDAGCIDDRGAGSRMVAQNISMPEAEAVAELPPAPRWHVERVDLEASRRRDSDVRELCMRRTAELTTFVGREKEVASILKLLAEGARLLVLTGAPGVGKTRLARRIAEVYAGPVAICDAVEVASIEELASRIDATIAAFSYSGISMSDGGPLLVIDDCDPLATLAGPAIEKWCTRAPALRFLVTSRESLAISSEQLYEVPPLPAVVADEGGPTCEAALLFLARARLRYPEYEPTAADARAIDRVVSAVDGNPLAIELAAGRLGVLSIAELAERLPREIDLLATKARNVPPRQRSMRDAIASSWNALAPWEKDALSQCASFVATFSIEDAAATVDLKRHTGAPNLMEVIEALHDKSLIRSVEGTTGSGCRRFAVYSSIRIVALEHRHDPLAIGPAGKQSLNAEPAAVAALVVAPDASSFTAPGGISNALNRKRSLRRVLLLLVERRLAAPGDTTSTDQLLRAGWPGERMTRRAGVNRVYVAIAALRAAGLRGVLVRVGQGYALRTDVPLVIDPDQAKGAATS